MASRFSGPVLSRVALDGAMAADQWVLTGSCRGVQHRAVVDTSDCRGAVVAHGAPVVNSRRVRALAGLTGEPPDRSLVIELDWLIANRSDRARRRER